MGSAGTGCIAPGASIPIHRPVQPPCVGTTHRPRCETARGACRTRCAHSHLWEQNPKRDCKHPAVHKDAQASGTLVRMGINNQNTNGFHNKILIWSRQMSQPNLHRGQMQHYTQCTPMCPAFLALALQPLAAPGQSGAAAAPPASHRNVSSGLR